MLNVTALLIPVFLLMVFAEWYISYKHDNHRYSAGNVIMNMAIGSIDQIGSLFFFSVLYLVLEYVSTHFRLIEVSSGWYQWGVGYLAVDFLSYWYHRVSHRVNILWAGHVTHHSSELFNFSNGFRTSLFQGMNRIVFWSVLPVFGFSPVVLIIILKVSGLYDFLLHTEYVPKLGFLEKILITPSSHRVHHGQNDLYIDKNYGSTFSVWDRMFGTYQEETEPVKYGVKGGYADKSPVWAIGYYYHHLWHTMRAIPDPATKLKLLFMPPEWQATQQQQQQGTTDPPPVRRRRAISQPLRSYVLFQVSCCVVGIILLLVFKNLLSGWEFLVGAFVGILTISNNAILFNNTVQEGFVRREQQRLALEAALVLLTLWVYPKAYLLGVLLFLGISWMLVVWFPREPVGA
jgi:alkylglycerol monooxygenase